MTDRGRPNVVMIVLDDLGFAQLGCYGSDIATPHIDALAERGFRYNNFHVTAVCSATRACLLTGRNHHAVGMGWLSRFELGFPGYSARIPRSAAALPRLLRDAEYSTFAVGKWHLTPNSETSPAGPFDQWPLGMGFERYYGFLNGQTNQWTPTLVCDNGFVEPPLRPEEDYHLTEDLASQAIRFVQDQQHSAPEKPFFLYFATGAVHTPHHVPRPWIDQYRGQFSDGWERWRDQTFARQQGLGVVPPNTRLTERPSWVPPWGDLASEERRLYERQMEVFAGFLTHTDAQIGRLLDFLAATEALNDTVIMLCSDNGASGEGGPHGFVSPQGADDTSVEHMLSRIDELGGVVRNNHYAWGWAWAGNSPFRLWKRHSWLGGVRVPLIVQWPDGVAAASRGDVRRQFCHAVDLMPTILETCGVKAPEAVDGVSQQPVDGASLLSTFTDADSPSPRTTQMFETMGSRAIYSDGWKATTNHVPSHKNLRVERQLVEGSQDFDKDHWSLVCLDDDFSESEDVALDNPGRLRQMIDLWWSEAGRNGVLPLMDSHEQHLAAMKVRSGPACSRMVHFPAGGPVVSGQVASRLDFATGFRLTADIEVPEGITLSGIICTQERDGFGGWAYYVVDGFLSVMFKADSVRSRVAAENVIVPGRHEVGMSYLPDSSGQEGYVCMTVDGRTVATAVVPATLPERFGAGKPAGASYFGGKLLVGQGQGFPVDDANAPPFAFTGHIHRVTFEDSAGLGAADD